MNDLELYFLTIIYTSLCELKSKAALRVKYSSFLNRSNFFASVVKLDFSAQL
jgi:hypothetical protein